jgi:hypothetical protein
VLRRRRDLRRRIALDAPLKGALRTGALAGSTAAIVNSVANHATQAVGLKSGSGGLARLVFGHSIGALGSEVFHLALGVAMALVYVLVVRDRLRGPGWLRGVVFAQLPGAIQLLGVLPLTGHGVGGYRLTPMTPLFAWSLNALYGAVMGELVERRWRIAARPSLNRVIRLTRQRR